MPRNTNVAPGQVNVHPRSCLRYCGGLFLVLAWMLLSVAQAQTTNYALGTAALLEGPAAGSDSVVLAVNPNLSPWTATSNADWLHLSAANQSGTGATNVVFSFDANPGATRLGALTIAGQTLTVTQAGSTYVAAKPLTTLVTLDLNYPEGVAVDSAGNVYIADTGNGAIKELTTSNGSVTTLVSSGLYFPNGLAVDSLDNVYIADTSNNAIKEWTAASGNVTTLVSNGLNFPIGVAVDSLDNVYIADTYNNAIKEWTVADSNVITLVSSGLDVPIGVAVDTADNVYIADTDNNAIKEWTAAANVVTTLASPELGKLCSAAVDGAGNVYVADSDNSVIEKWTAASGTLTTLVSSGLNQPFGVAVDVTGNVYIADANDNAIKELPYAFVDPTARMESSAAGTDALPVVLPAAENLLGPFAPTSDQSWLTLSGITNGIVSFSFPANTGSNRTANITLLGQDVPVTQAGFTYSLDTNSVFEGPTTGSDSVVLTVIPNNGTWTATANAAWLHLSMANQSGTGSASVVFSFDENLGAPRSGTLTIASQTLAVTQASATYSLGVNALLEATNAGSDSVSLTVIPQTATWSATANAPWLHLTAANQSGTGSANVAFSFDANPGPARSGTLTIAGQTLIVVQGTPNFSVAPATVLEGPMPGSDSVILAANPNFSPWTATSSANWLHLNAASQTGAGATNVVFRFDTNPGATRSGALTVAGQTVMVIQAGSTYVAAGPFTTLVSTNLNFPQGVAVDGFGNVYIADTENSAVEEWVATNNTVITLVSTELNRPQGVAVDGAGNVYIADTENNQVDEWTAANGNVTTLVSTGLDFPIGVAVDNLGNVYIADSHNNAIKEWVVAANTVTTLVSTGLNFPVSVAVDSAGNVYIADTDNNAIKEWTPANNAVITLVSPDVGYLSGVAVDGEGNVYIADAYNSKIEKWTAASNTLTTLVSSGLNGPSGVAVDGEDNIYIADTDNNAVEELPRAFVNVAGAFETAPAGYDALPVVLPATENLLAPFAPTADPGWLTLTGVTNDAVDFSFPDNIGPGRTDNVTVLGQTITVTQGPPTYTLGTNALLETSAAGSDSVILTVIPQAAAWTAVANATWLHLSQAAQSGTGSATVAFSFDANPGVMRSGTLTIEGQTLTVTQAGATYTLGSNALMEGNNAGSDSVLLTVIPQIATWTATANAAWLHLSPATQSGAGSMAVVFSFDANPGAIRSGTLAIAGQTLTVTQAGATYSLGINALMEANNAGGDSVVLTVSPQIATWTAAANVAWLHLSTGAQSGAGSTTVVFSFDANTGATRSGSLTIAGETLAITQAGATYSLGTNTFLEGANAGSDSVPLTITPQVATWTAAANAAWLHLSPANQSGAGSATVVFSFDANPGTTRSGTLTIAAQTVTVIQSGPNFTLGTTARLEGPTAGSDSVILAVNPNFGHWTATTNANWLHLSAANRSGTGATNLIFSFDANSGSTRGGAITIGGQTLNVTQAGASYIAAGPFTILVSSNLNNPEGVAVDGAGNVYIADTGNSAINQLIAANTDAATLVSSGLSNPYGVAVDAEGNVYIADTSDDAIKEWTPANGNLTALVSSGLSNPQGVAVDDEGNVYIADSSDGAIKEWTAANSNVTTLVSSGLNALGGVAVDGAGNVYIADTSDGTIKEWTAANSNVTTLVSSGLNAPGGVAVDGAGNVYIADTFNYAIKKWSAANKTVSVLVSSGLNRPEGVAVNVAGNVYIADTWNNVIEELPYAFVDSAPRLESLAAGSDALPVVLPSTINLFAPFAPTSDQSWLTITGINNDVVSFSFTESAGASRTAHITLLGQTIPITQAGVIPPAITVLQMLPNGVFQFAFSNTQGASFTVISTTNLSLPFSEWTVAGTARNTAPGQFVFTSQPITNDPRRFYAIRSP